MGAFAQSFAADRFCHSAVRYDEPYRLARYENSHSFIAYTFKHSFYYLVLGKLFANQPKELEESAKIDGAGEWTAF